MDKKEHQPLELEELDLALPEDLNLGEHDAADAGLDDLELPELTGDDDLAELDLGDAPAEPEHHDLSEAGDASLPETMGEPAEDEEPIALSEEELERIIGSKDSELFSDFSDAETAHTDLDLEPSSEMHADSEMHSDLESDSSDLSMDLTSDFSTDHGGEASEMDLSEAGPSDFGDMHTDLEEEGPVSLSEEELGNILGDVGESVDMPGEDHAGAIEHEAEEPAPAGIAVDDSEDESITLSDDELNNILLDSSDLESHAAHEEAPPLSELSMDEDDGPIALTPEELGNIISDVHEETEDSMGAMPEMDMEASSEFDAHPEFGSDFGDEHAAPASLLDEEDEGPVALSDAELDSILEDVHEETVHPSAEHADTRANLIVLDEYEDREREEQTAVPVPSAARMDHVAEEAGVKKDELRKMISYLDQLFDKLPEDTVREFSKSEYFDLYKKIMEDLNLT